MKITVIVPSRGRTNGLIAALHSLHSLESGKHEVRYGVVCDVDDPTTIATCQSLGAGMSMSYYVQDRNPSLGAMVNTMAEHMPADVYLSLADDVLCLTPKWDEKIAEGWAANPKGVWWWKPARDDQPVLYAIVSDEWKKAAGRIFTDYFPFWYDDLWLLSLWILAVEGPMLTLDISIMDCPRQTHRMRDLRFWHNFYLSMAPVRAQEAKRIAKTLDFPQSRIVGAAVGLPDLSITDALAERLSVTPQEFEDTMEKIEANQGAKDEPTAEYVAAKTRAELIMKQNAFLTAAIPSLQRMVA